MSPAPRTLTTLGTLAVAGAVAAAIPAASQGATVRTTSASASTITLGSAFRSGLRSQGVALAAGRPATLSGARLRLPVSATRAASGATTLTHTGTLTLRKGARSAKLTSFRTVVRGRAAAVSALLAGKRRTVFAVSGGRVTRDAATGAATVTGGTVRLASAAVAPLRTRLRARGLKAGVVGRIATTARPAAAAPATPAAPTPTTPGTPAPTTPAPATPAPTTPAPVACPLPGAGATALTGRTTWRLRESWVSYVRTFGGTITGTEGADRTAPDQNVSWSYPQASLSTSAAGERVVAHTGRLQFRVPAHLIDTQIRNPRIVVAADGRTARLCADGQSSGSRSTPGGAAFENAHLLDLDLSKAGTGAAPDASTRLLTNVPATVADNDEAAEVMSYDRKDAYGSFDLPLPNGG